MRDRDVRAWREAVDAHLDALGDLEAAHRRAREWAKGAYLASPSGSSGTPSAISDPTGRRALAGDPLALDARNAEHHAGRVLSSLRWLTRYVARHPAPTGHGLADDGCRSCARVGQWSPIAVHATGVETVPRAPLCRWCADVVYATRRWPGIEALTLHAQGRRVPASLIDTP